jgi:ABC-type multidrug transport system ATPase subunit
VSGFALSGEVLVISGDEEVKQEVMDILSQNENTSPTESGKQRYNVSYNGIQYDHSRPQPSSSFLEPLHAVDCLYDDMTVEETLLFADAVRTPIWDTSASMTAHVIDCLELQPLLTSFNKELTRVQRYIVLLAAEVVTKKEVIYLQDPVVGLSLTESNDVLHAISRVAKTLRRLVVVTLTHFCQNHVQHYIDRLLLVSSSGVVFFGRAEDASKVFLEHTPPLQVDLGNSFSDLLKDLCAKKLLQDDDRSSFWSEDELRQSRYTEGNYSLRTLPMKRETSYSPFAAGMERAPTRVHRVKPEPKGVSEARRLMFYLRITWWLLWRAWIVRVRNSSQLISQVVYGGLAPGGGLSITFAHLDNDVSGEPFSPRLKPFSFLLPLHYALDRII